MCACLNNHCLTISLSVYKYTVLNHLFVTLQSSQFIILLPNQPVVMAKTVCDCDMVVFSELPSVVSLNLEETGITEEGLILYLGSCPQCLQHLNLSRTKVTEKIFSYLKSKYQIFPRLKAIHITKLDSVVYMYSEYCIEFWMYYFMSEGNVTYFVFRILHKFWKNLCLAQYFKDTVLLLYHGWLGFASLLWNPFTLVWNNFSYL